MPRIIWDEQAEQDLRDYAHYLGIERQSPQGAISLVRAIKDACQLIAKNPLLGEARPELGNELRVFSCGAKKQSARLRSNLSPQRRSHRDSAYLSRVTRLPCLVKKAVNRFIPQVINGRKTR